MEDIQMVVKVGIVIAAFLLIVLILYCIYRCIPEKKLTLWNDNLVKGATNRRKVFIVLLLVAVVIAGLCLHFLEIGLIQSKGDLDRFGHGVGSSVSMTLIMTLIGIITVVGFFYTINEIKSSVDPKIVDYHTFYNNCIELFRNSLKKGGADYFHFSGNSLLPGAFFQEFDEYTTKNKNNSESYYAKLQEVMKNDNDYIKDIRFILPGCWKEILDDFREKMRPVVGEIDPRRWSSITTSYKDLFQLDSTELKNLKLGLARKDDDFIRYMYISNGQEMIFAMTMNLFDTLENGKKTEGSNTPNGKSTKKKLPFVIIGVKINRADTIKHFYDRFMKHWEELEKRGEQKKGGSKDLLILSGSDNIKNYQHNNLSESIKRLCNIQCKSEDSQNT